MDLLLSLQSMFLYNVITLKRSHVFSKSAKHAMSVC